MNFKLVSSVVLSAWVALSATQAIGGTEVSVIKERFFTTDQSRENIDSPAVWVSSGGAQYLLATSKEGHSVNVFDAINGASIQRIGGLGIELGQFSRPNGIWVIDDMMLVVERDNRRVQVLSLPDMLPITSFGEAVLKKPYGLYVRKVDAGEYDVYVTDNYETEMETIPADADLGERVQVFRLEKEGMTGEGEQMHAFGATTGAGRLFVVESIYGDPAHNRLLVAEELEDDALGRQVKIYDLDGNFTGKTIGSGVFKAQVEGIALYPTSDTEGYWFITDQSKIDNVFHIFDRASLNHLGSFKGERTLNTDGVWISTVASEQYPLGMFYACDNDRAVSAFDLREIFAALKLK